MRNKVTSTSWELEFPTVRIETLFFSKYNKDYVLQFSTQIDIHIKSQRRCISENQ